MELRLENFKKSPKLTSLNKIKTQKKKLAHEIKNDEALHEEKIFAGRRMSSSQKYLKSLHTNKQFLDEMYLKHDENNKETACNDQLKCELQYVLLECIFTRR